MYKAIFAIGFLFFGLPLISVAQDTTAIDRILAAYNGENPGASLLVVQDGRVLLQRHYGYADLEHKQPVSATTNFRLASVSKQFTATCILQLVHQGKLAMGTTLAEAFPGFPAYGNTVTVKHLLTHTSGIPDYEDYVADTAFNPQIKDQGVLDILMKLESGYFKPGTQFRYSNSGYALLALMVARYSGQPFAAYLQQHIFAPLGMTSTLAHEEGKTTVPVRAFGYSATDGRWVRRDQSSTSAVLGDGGIYSNVLDMLKWDQALYTGSVLPIHWIDESFAYHRLAGGGTVGYGYGWHLKQTKDGHKAVYHTGSSTSFRNIFYRIPSRRFSIILLTNRNEPREEDMLTLAELIAEVLRP
ncbi:CubicO group peptidase, beta-lactamase class C family [Parapedobacter composti]|uniref:CubicO group peptidase, beta-lactamase class C family n=2 Tax=Parapedobacter composti TaxID=623281 RepID=A0A1I1M9N5_9SPHI|nr:CubicO group peptidase, beta-lactamase class C family [Parapedobacter composti]